MSCLTKSSSLDTTELIKFLVIVLKFQSLIITKGQIKQFCSVLKLNAMTDQFPLNNSGDFNCDQLQIVKND